MDDRATTVLSGTRPDAALFIWCIVGLCLVLLLGEGLEPGSLLRTHCNRPGDPTPRYKHVQGHRPGVSAGLGFPVLGHELPHTGETLWWQLCLSCDKDVGPTETTGRLSDLECVTVPSCAQPSSWLAPARPCHHECSEPPGSLCRGEGSSRTGGGPRWQDSGRALETLPPSLQWPLPTSGSGPSLQCALPSETQLERSAATEDCSLSHQPCLAPRLEGPLGRRCLRTSRGQRHSPTSISDSCLV